MNFRNERPSRYNCRLYNNHVKVTGNHVKVAGYHVMYDRSAWFPRDFTRFVFLAVSEEVETWLPNFAFVQCIIKQLLDSVFAISRIIKVSVRVISLSLQLQLITLTSTLIILDITKTSSNNCLLLSDTSCNALWVTILFRHGMHLLAKSTHFISLKAGQNIHTFLGTVPTTCHVQCNSPKYLCCALEVTCF